MNARTPLPSPASRPLLAGAQQALSSAAPHLSREEAAEAIRKAFGPNARIVAKPSAARLDQRAHEELKEATRLIDWAGSEYIELWHKAEYLERAAACMRRADHAKRQARELRS